MPEELNIHIIQCTDVDANFGKTLFGQYGYFALKNLN